MKKAVQGMKVNIKSKKKTQTAGKLKTKNRKLRGKFHKEYKRQKRGSQALKTRQSKLHKENTRDGREDLKH